MFNKALSFRDAGGSIHIEVLDDGGVYTGEKTKDKSKPEGDYLFKSVKLWEALVLGHWLLVVILRLSESPFQQQFCHIWFHQERITEQ